MKTPRRTTGSSVVAAGLLIATGAALLFSWRSHSDQIAAAKAQTALQAAIQSAIKRREIVIGMTSDQVHQSWGYPNGGAKQTITSQGAEDRWNYTHTEHGVNLKINIQTRFSLVFSNDLLVKWEQE